MNPKRHSFSRISTFSEICERRHAFDALIESNWDTPAIKRGNHVHDALEQMANLMVEGATAVEAAEQIAENPPEGYLKPKVLASYLERAVPVFEHLKPRRGGVESWFRKVCDLPIIGKIDLISDWTPQFDSSGLPIGHIERPCVIDHKTIGSPARIKTPYEARKSLQLMIYELATGARDAGFIYFLPSGAARGVMTAHDEESLEIARKWLTGTIDVIDSRWKEAAVLAGTDKEGPVIEGFNLSPFALAQVGHGLCNAKHCTHWSKCLGRESK